MLTTQNLTVNTLTPTIQDQIFADLDRIAMRFPALTLNEIQEYALQDRVDTKYLMRLSDLPELLKELTTDHSILEVAGQRISNYRTLYFDTPAFNFYHDHHNGKRPRFKIRMREYISNNQAFLEIKKKENSYRTTKDRIEIASMQETLSPSMKGFLMGNYPGEVDSLRPVLWNTFSRMTLVNHNTCERITIDSGLYFFNMTHSLELSHLAVVELKQDSFSRDAVVVHSLKGKGYQPISFSKFCTGVAILNPTIKRNQFKKNFLQFKATTKRTYDHVNFTPVHA